MGWVVLWSWIKYDNFSRTVYVLEVLCMWITQILILGSWFLLLIICGPFNFIWDSKKDWFLCFYVKSLWDRYHFFFKSMFEFFFLPTLSANNNLQGGGESCLNIIGICVDYFRLGLIDLWHCVEYLGLTSCYLFWLDGMWSSRPVYVC